MKGKMWADVWLAEDTGTEPVCLVYESNNRASLYIQAPVLGSFPAVTQKHFQESVFSFLMILGMWGTGIVSAIVFWYMKAHHIVESVFWMHHCLCSSVVCGVIWTQVFIRCTEIMVLLGWFFLFMHLFLCQFQCSGLCRIQ